MGLTVLDAGVMIAGLDADDIHHAAAADVLTAARDRGDSFVLPASAYAETLVRPADRGATTVARVDSALDAMAIVVADTDRTIARRAATLRARHPSLRLPDALVIAAAIELEARPPAHHRPAMEGTAPPRTPWPSQCGPVVTHRRHCLTTSRLPR